VNRASRLALLVTSVLLLSPNHAADLLPSMVHGGSSFLLGKVHFASQSFHERTVYWATCASLGRPHQYRVQLGATLRGGCCVEVFFFFRFLSASVLVWEGGGESGTSLLESFLAIWPDSHAQLLAISQHHHGPQTWGAGRGCAREVVV
jgi:hypothetical protein